MDSVKHEKLERFLKLRSFENRKKTPFKSLSRTPYSIKKMERLNTDHLKTRRRLLIQGFFKDSEKHEKYYLAPIKHNFNHRHFFLLMRLMNGVVIFEYTSIIRVFFSHES